MLRGDEPVERQIEMRACLAEAPSELADELDGQREHEVVAPAAANGVSAGPHEDEQDQERCGEPIDQHAPPRPSLEPDPGPCEFPAAGASRCCQNIAKESTMAPRATEPSVWR